MRTVPLDQGETLWVFGDEEVTKPMRASLVESSSRLRQVAARLPGGRVGWTGAGLEYELYPSGQRCLGGFAENDQVSFLAALRPPGFYPHAPGSSWKVEAEIGVRCDAEVDCGMHTVESFERPSLKSAADAVAALDAATRWLVHSAAVVPPADWRERDPRRGHR